MVSPQHLQLQPQLCLTEMLDLCIFQMIAQNGLRSKLTRQGREICLRPGPGRSVSRPNASPAKTQILSQVGGCSGVILVQKSVYSRVSKSPTTSKIFPSRIRMYHV